MYRFSHMGLASFLTGSFVVAGVSAWFLIQGRDVVAHRKALSMCLWMILVLAPAQVVMGDLHGLNTMEHQPTKLAAMEGNWETGGNVPLLLFALPDQDEQDNRFEVGIPNLASLILTHKADGEVPGLDAVPKEEQPPVALVFWSFRVMVGVGMLMLMTGFVGLVYRLRGKLYDSPLFHRSLVALIPAPFVAVLAGWFVTELGRSPWLVYGYITYKEGITPALTTEMALATLIGFGLVYFVVYASGFRYILKTVRQGTEID